MFVYDVTNYSSFEDLDDWYSYVSKCFKEAGSDMPKCALVANKSESVVDSVSMGVYSCLPMYTIHIQCIRVTVWLLMYNVYLCN